VIPSAFAVLRLMISSTFVDRTTGQLAGVLACKNPAGVGARLIAPSKIRVSVIGPIDEEVRGTLGAEAEKDWEFKFVPGGLVLTFPAEHAAEALVLLRHGRNSFVAEAMARVRRSVSLEDHVPEAVAYIASVVCRELPQPVAEGQDPEQLDDVSDDDASAGVEERTDKRLTRARVHEVVAVHREKSAIGQRQYRNARRFRRPTAQPGDLVRVAQRQ
jgi:hypothetical protein